MDFFKKIVENKALTGAIVAGTALILGSVYLYSSYKNEGNEDQKQSNQLQLNLQKQIQGLKSQVNVTNPSLDDVKKILQFSMNFAKKKIYAYSREFKKKRLQYNNQSRKQNMKQYMNMISIGMQEVRNIATNTQAEIMKDLGLTQASFLKYQSQLGMFMQQLMMRQSKNQGTKQLTLEQIKYAIRLQIEYLKNDGVQILDKILEATKSWPANKKSELPLLLSVVVADGAFEDHPQIDQQAVQAAQMQMQHHLINQMTELQQVMTPLMQKLSAQLGGGMGGLGGFGGFNMDDMGGDGQGGDGDPFGGLTVEQMQQLQELERMRLEDPAAFEQMMRNMYG